jgi:DNA-binding MurR/RpiR family transcriptional regulator
MRTSAREAGVTPATMTRLAQRLGFDGFEALRAPFMRHLAGNAALASVRRVNPGRAPGGAKAAAVAAPAMHVARQLDNVASVRALNAPQALQDVADALLRARNVGFLGLRVCHGAAVHMHYVYGHLATNGVLLDDQGGTLPDQITRLQHDDVMLAISQAPYTRQTVEGVQLAHEQGAQVIALTDSALSPIARRAQHVLLFETVTNSFFRSTLGAEALCELLLATLATRGGAPAQARLLQMKDHLRRTRAYWERADTAPGSRRALAAAATSAGAHS